ncbi:hypothetical protein F2Q70_00037128 [Brassica cretica]|uniref:Uncharacterized protein n=1 Tax=Brassica cretica TaxID=69181 RepID=A0A8S9JQW3_BRACR|nr:hypothetical protein F2Q70_00037128 [Brassica cretica]
MKEEPESKDQKCLKEVEANVDMELGNEAEAKVSKILENGIFGDRVKGDATLSKILMNNQDGLQRKAVPGKELQVEFKELPVSMDASQRVSAQGGAAETQEKSLEGSEAADEEYERTS